MIPTFLVVKELGFVNTIWGMVLPGAVGTWNLLIMRTFFMGMPQELEESGKIDGLSEIGIFFRIVLPLSKPVLATIGLYYAVGMWNNFMGPPLYLRDADMPSRSKHRAVGAIDGDGWTGCGRYRGGGGWLEIRYHYGLYLADPACLSVYTEVFCKRGFDRLG